MKKYGSVIIDNEKNNRDALALMLTANCPGYYLNWLQCLPGFHFTNCGANYQPKLQ
jgi:hypothetical protein